MQVLQAIYCPALVIVSAIELLHPFYFSYKARAVQ